MGHDIATHRQYYRLPSETILLTKVSKILMAADKGVIMANRRKTLQEMVVDEHDEVEPDVDSISSSNSRSSSNGARNNSDYSPPHASPVNQPVQQPPSSRSANFSAGTKFAPKYNKWSQEEDDFMLSQTWRKERSLEKPGVKLSSEEVTGCWQLRHGKM